MLHRVAFLDNVTGRTVTLTNNVNSMRTGSPETLKSTPNNLIFSKFTPTILKHSASQN